jgi:hypothetical protein
MLTSIIVGAIVVVVLLVGVCAIAAAIGAGRADGSHERHSLPPL